MAVRSASSRRGAVHVVEVSRSALVEDVKAELKHAGLTLDQFIKLGRSGDLRDERLRDLWLMAGPAFE